MDKTLKKHLLITGLVRTGTSFLISYYSRLGFNTGYPKKIVDKIMSKNHRFHGGIEILDHYVYRKKLHDVEVIKAPWSYVDRKPPQEKINQFNLTFDYIILTSRDHKNYAKSLSNTKSIRLKIKETKKKEIEEKAFKAAPLKMQALEDWVRTTNSQVIKVKFPKSIENFEYLWKQLQPTFLIKNITKEKAYKHWLALRNLNYVNFK